MDYYSINKPPLKVVSGRVAIYYIQIGINDYKVFFEDGAKSTYSKDGQDSKFSDDFVIKDPFEILPSKPIYDLIDLLDNVGLKPDDTMGNDSTYRFFKNENIQLLIHEYRDGKAVFADKKDSFDKFNKCTIQLPLPNGETQMNELLVYLDLIGKAPVLEENLITTYYSRF